MATTFAKLQSGNWGILTTEDVHTGDTVTVNKFDGTTTTVTAECLVSPAGVVPAVWTIKKEQKQNRTRCAECGRGGQLVQDLEDGLMKHYRCCDIPPTSY